MHHQDAEETYDVALSFAGEDRATVEKFAGELRQRGISVFYDRFVEAELWGKNLYDYLADVYSKRCRYCVVFVSRSYATKEWTRLERNSAQARALREKDEFLLPVRLDDTELPGLLSTTAYVDLREQPLVKVVDLLCKKLGCQTKVGELPGNQGRLVIELRSEFEPRFGSRFENRKQMADMHELVLNFLGTSECRIVGCEPSPHRLQIQTNPTGYSRLRTKFLSGELESTTNVKWTSIAALEGKERAPAPTQTPLAVLRAGSTAPSKGQRSVVCHLEGITGFDVEGQQALSCLGSKVTSDWRRLRAFITTRNEFVYIHSNFQKPGCSYPTKIATNIPVDLFTLFINLTTLEMPDAADLSEADLAHTKYAEYLVKANAMGKRGDEFYAGAMNIRFV